MHTRSRWITLLVMLITVSPASLLAQAAPPSGVTDTARPPAPLFTRRDAVMGAAFAVGTIAMFPLDRRLAKHITNAGAAENRFYRDASTGVEAIASPGAYIIGATLYTVGRLGRFQRVADLGWHGTEAVFVADATTLALKGIMGRSRPFVSADTNAHDFKLFRGFSNTDRKSFPSGHTTSAFAAAAAVTAETGRWWPRSTIVIGPLMFGGATMVGLSRMYHNRHWASDVVLGAAIGTFAGQKVVQYSHAHGTRIDRIMLSHVAVVPNGQGGYVVSWSSSPP